MVVTLLCHSEEHRDEESVFPLPAFKKTDPSTPLRSAQDDTEIITKRKAPTFRSRLVFALPIFPGERWERRRGRNKRPERVAAVGNTQACFARRSGCRAPQQEARQVLVVVHELNFCVRDGLSACALPAADEAQVLSVQRSTIEEGVRTDERVGHRTRPQAFPPPVADEGKAQCVQRSTIEDGVRTDERGGHRKRKQVDRPPFPELISKRKSPDLSVEACVRITYLPGQSPAKYCRRT